MTRRKWLIEFVDFVCSFCLALNLTKNFVRNTLAKINLSWSETVSFQTPNRMFFRSLGSDGHRCAGLWAWPPPERAFLRLKSQDPNSKKWTKDEPKRHVRLKRSKRFRISRYSKHVRKNLKHLTKSKASQNLYKTSRTEIWTACNEIQDTFNAESENHPNKSLWIIQCLHCHTLHTCSTSFLHSSESQLPCLYVIRGGYPSRILWRDGLLRQLMTTESRVWEVFKFVPKCVEFFNA